MFNKGIIVISHQINVYLVFLPKINVYLVFSIDGVKRARINLFEFELSYQNILSSVFYT